MAPHKGLFEKRLKKLTRRNVLRDLRLYLLPLLVLVGGLAVTLHLYTTMLEWDEQKKQIQQIKQKRVRRNRNNEFRLHSRIRLEAVQSVFQRQLELLEALRLLFTKRFHVERENFHAFATIPLQRHPEILGYFWIPRVEPADMDEFQKMVLSSGAQEADSQRQGATKSFPESTDSPFWPVMYATPSKVAQKWVGENAKNHPLLERGLSRMSQTPDSSPSFALSRQKNGNVRQASLILPVQQPGPVFENGEKEITYEQGAVAVLIDLSRLLDEALSSFEEKRFTMYFLDAEGRLIGTYGKNEGISDIEKALGEEDPTDTSELPLWRSHWRPVAGVEWEVVSIPAFGKQDKYPDDADNIRERARIALSLGIIISILTSGYLFTMYREVKHRREAEKELRKMARHDSLTGLLNHRTFFEELQLEIKRGERYQRPLSLLMIDLDYFKQVNDNYGHQLGDTVLENIGQIVKNKAREVDFAGRYGGEEFAVALPETRASEARQLAERIRGECASQSYQSAENSFSVTCSIGIAGCRETSITAEELVAKADIALYEAKKNGRNQTVLYE